MLTTDEMKKAISDEGYIVLQCRLDDGIERIKRIEKIIKRKPKYCLLITGHENGGYITKENVGTLISRVAGMLLWDGGQMTITPHTSVANLRANLREGGILTECNICMEEEGTKGCPQCTFRYCLECRDKGFEQAHREGVFKCGICRHPLFTAVTPA